MARRGTTVLGGIGSLIASSNATDLVGGSSLIAGGGTGDLEGT